MGQLIPTTPPRGGHQFRTADQAGRSQEPPVVRVHIGRIDVRAEAPPAPKPPTVRNGVKPQNLDEYLQARQRGSR
jgi:hypothetical protein